MKTKWLQIVLVSLAVLLFVNILHMFFLYEKEWKPITITYTVETDYTTTTWLSIKPAFQDTTILDHKVTLEASSPQVISYTIKQPSGIDFLGVFWSRSDLGAFTLGDISIKSQEKEWKLASANDLISYSSTNISTTLIDKKLKASSKLKGNGWLMIDKEILSEISKKKNFLPFHWVTNLILLMILVAVLSQFYSSIKKQIGFLVIEGDTIQKLRGYVFYLWLFLLPFWLLVSHVLLALSLALLLLQLFLQKKNNVIRQAQKFWPFLLLFLSIISIDVLFHPTDVSNDFGDYIYFLLAPFLFLGLDKEVFKKTLRVLQIGVLLYLILLLITIFERYTLLGHTTSWTLFLFEKVNQYWHTSYLASLVVIVFLPSLILSKKIKAQTIAIWLIAFVFFYFLQARLPLMIGLFMLCFIALKHIPKARKKYYFIALTSAGIFLIALLLLSEQYRTSFSAIFLKTKTEKQDARPELWEAGMQISKKQFLKGVGRSNVRSELSKRIDPTSDIKNREYNAHNQYIEFLVSYGILIPALLFLILLFPLWKKRPMTSIFAIYFMLAMIVESYLARQSGIVIFSIFFCFYTMYDEERKLNL